MSFKNTIFFHHKDICAEYECTPDIFIYSPKFCPLFIIPKTLRDQLGNSIRRVVMVANNPCISLDLVQSVIKSQDLLVFFNNAMHLHLFNEFKNTRLFFFRSKGDSHQHFGLPPLPNHVDELEILASKQPFSVIYSACDPDISNLPPNMKLIFSNPNSACLIEERHPAWSDYAYKSNIPFAGPSSGFMLYRIFVLAQQSRCLTQTSKTPFEILLLGFNNTRGSTFWEGHNWEFERSEMKNQAEHIFLISALDAIAK